MAYDAFKTIPHAPLLWPEGHIQRPRCSPVIQTNEDGTLVMSGDVDGSTVECSIEVLRGFVATHNDLIVRLRALEGTA